MKAFLASDGTKILIDILLTSLQCNAFLKSANEGASATLSSSTSTPSLLVAVLRSTVIQLDLPFLDIMRERMFPLPRPDSVIPTLPNIEKLSISVEGDDEKQSPNSIDHVETSPAQNKVLSTVEVDHEYERHAELYAESIKNHAKLTDFNEELMTTLKAKLIELCPEIYTMFGLSEAQVDAPTGNIRVHHVQPMLPGKHIFCRNTLAQEPEPQLRRSPTNQRYTALTQKSNF
jgi:hypothetical protein